MTDSEIYEYFHSLTEKIDYSIEEIEKFYDSEIGVYNLTIEEHEHVLENCKKIFASNRLIHQKIYELYIKLLEKDILNDLNQNIIGFSYSSEMSQWHLMKSVEYSLEFKKKDQNERRSIW